MLRRPQTLGVLALSTLAILANWTIFVVAVDTGHVIEASLGYYINPLMNMAAGALLFRERMDRSGKIAVALAAVGVAIQTAALGRAPTISLGIAISFCIYAILRKRAKAEAQRASSSNARTSRSPPSSTCCICRRAAPAISAPARA